MQSSSPNPHSTNGCQYSYFALGFDRWYVLASSTRLHSVASYPIARTTLRPRFHESTAGSQRLRKYSCPLIFHLAEHDDFPYAIEGNNPSLSSSSSSVT